jgi:Trk-type K+ transport system membrane component
MLLKIVAAYYVLVQLIPMIILSPIFQGGHYNWLFRDQDQGSMTGAGGWYVTFNVVSAYSNSGLSLLDESMTPFQQSYG